MIFYESTHKYIEDGQEFTPVTYFIKSFQEWVDWDKEAEKKAKKLGIPKEELLKQWETNRNNASEKGTRFHKKMEDKYLISTEGIQVNDTILPVSYVNTIDGVKEDKSIKLEDNTVYTEKMIWSNKYKICGTADLVEVVDGKINIKDYKTNAKLEFEAWKHPLKGSKKLKYPVNSLDDCNGSIYQLQLNVYMYMLLMQNRHLKMGDMTLLHVVFEEGSENEFKMIPYTVKPLIKEVGAMLEYYRQKNNK